MRIRLDPPIMGEATTITVPLEEYLGIQAELESLFPDDEVRYVALEPGDRVEVLGELESVADPDAAVADYREAPPTILVPRSVPTLRVAFISSSTRWTASLVASGVDGQSLAENLAPPSGGFLGRRRRGGAEQLGTSMSSMARDLATIERHFPLIEEADGKQKKRYRIERNDDPDEAISGREFLDQIPEKIAARMIRVLEAVAEAPTHV